MRPHIDASQLPRGFEFSAVACGLKKSGLDLGLITSETPATAACVFTTNLVKAAPVSISQTHLRRSAEAIRAIIVNSGNANCATGAQGLAAARRTAASVARTLRCKPEQILVCSTGVIGLPLRVERILRAVPNLAASRSIRPESYAQFTRAIVTTDTRPKVASASCGIGGKKVRFLGCAKGAG
ncbi:MAG: bifunctional ornithine acetyltransferase/N-acetylglutamate synthase, partial [Candidatus Acidiferrales bacterium]